ncbi:MAG: hypothetical protein Q8P16_00390 [bacterium]|nr:hypothetical protein [bacterium]
MDEYNNTNPVPGQENAPVHEEQPQGGGTGPMIGAGIIVAVLIAGGLYFWWTQMSENNGSLQDDDAAMMEENATLGDGPNAGSDPQAIEEDLNEFDSASFDAALESDLEALESEF